VRAVSMKHEATESSRLIKLASQHVAKGASSTMRVLDYHLPLVVDRTDGARVWDADGNELIDMNMGYGPLLFGHRPKFINDAIIEELGRRGTVSGFAETLSIEAGELIKASFPAIDLLRFSSTGSETAQTAVRLARAYTGRRRLVLFEGHYHGSTDATFHRYHADPQALEGQKGAPVAGTDGMDGSPRDAIVVPYNDADALAAVLDQHGADIAAVMLEPVMGNAGVIPPEPGYLQEVRRLVDQHGALLIFDEVITGFRIARGGAQERYGVAADITMLSKAVSGGVPLSAVGGRREIMQLLVDGVVFHGGVYSGNPMSLAATVAVQRAYAADAATIHAGIEAAGVRLETGLREQLQQAGIPAIVQRVGGMMSLWLTRGEAKPPLAYREAAHIADAPSFIRLQHAAQRAGLYFHPNHFEPWYLSTAHTPAIIDEALDRFATALKQVRQSEPA